MSCRKVLFPWPCGPQTQISDLRAARRFARWTPDVGGGDPAPVAPGAPDTSTFPPGHQNVPLWQPLVDIDVHVRHDVFAFVAVLLEAEAHVDAPALSEVCRCFMHGSLRNT